MKIENGVLTDVNERDLDLLKSNPDWFWASVTSIGKGAFNGCSLTEIEIPNSVKEIQSGVFSGCRSLTKVTLPQGLTTIPDLLFERCTSLTEIEIPKSVTSIGMRAFYCCGITKIEIPDSVKEIENGAFSNCQDLETVILPQGLTTIPKHLFDRCKSLETIDIPTSVTSIGKEAFNECGLTEIDIPNSVKEIQAGAFGGCENLSKVTLPQGLTTIPKQLFYLCERLTEIDIPKSVTIIEEYAFMNCNQLTEINIPESVKTIEAGAFSYCSNLTKVTLPQGLTTIPEKLFTQCTSLTEIDIQKSVTSIGEAAFSSCSLTEIEIPDSVKEIQAAAFSHCKDLETVILPQRLTTIPKRLFEGCTSLETIDIPTSVTSIGEESFRDCSLTEIEIPDSVKEIQAGAFSGCKNLSEVTLPQGLTTIPNRLFEDCKSLTELNIPKSVTSIGKEAFIGCQQLTQLNIPDSVVTIEDEAFRGCSLTEINLPESVARIGKNAFVRCKGLTSITIPNGVELDKDAFSGLDVNCKIHIKQGNSVKTVNPIVFKFMSLSEIKDSDLKFKRFNNLLKQMGIGYDTKNVKNLAGLMKFARALGLFESDNVMTVDNKGKQVQVNNYAYTLLQGIFVRPGELKAEYGNIDKLTSDMQSGKYNEEFLKFMSKTDNRGEKLEKYKNNLCDIYKWFEERTNLIIDPANEKGIPSNEKERFQVYHSYTANAGHDKSEWSTATYDLILKDITDIIFNAKTEREKQIAAELSKHKVYRDQKYFDKAVEIDDERQKLVEEGKVTNHILSFHLKEVIDEYKEETDDTVKEILKNCADATIEQGDSLKNLFKYEMLSKDSVENFAMGIYTDCCAKLYGAGAGAQRAMIIHPDLQPLVIRDKNGVIVAFSILYVNREKGYVVANDLEVNFKYAGNKTAVKQIYGKFKQGVEAFATAYNKENDIPIKQVNCGISPNWKQFDRDEEITFNKLIKKNEKGEILEGIDFGEYQYAGKGDWPGDWKNEQYVIWKQGGNENDREL